MTRVKAPELVLEFVISYLTLRLDPDENKPLVLAVTAALFWSAPWALVLRTKDTTEASVPSTDAVAEEYAPETALLIKSVLPPFSK